MRSIRSFAVELAQLPLEERLHPLVEVAVRRGAEAVLLARVDRVLEGLAGVDQRLRQRDGVLRVDVVVAGAVDDEERSASWPAWVIGEESR
jgi:hypothetical protein